MLLRRKKSRKREKNPFAPADPVVLNTNIGLCQRERPALSPESSPVLGSEPMLIADCFCSGCCERGFPPTGLCCKIHHSFQEGIFSLAACWVWGGCSRGCEEWPHSPCLCRCSMGPTFTLVLWPPTAAQILLRLPPPAVP